MTSKQFESTLIAGLNSGAIHTDESLLAYIRKIHSALSVIHEDAFQLPLSPDDELSYLRRLKSIFQTSQGEARVLEDGHDNWFAAAETCHDYFEDYINYLQQKGFPEQIRAALGRDARLITSLMANPKSSDLKSKKG